MQNRYEGKINHWMLDDDYLLNSGVSSENMNHFIATIRRLYTSIASFPSPLYTEWRKNNQEIFASIGRNYAILPYNPKIDEFDTSELLNRWAYKFYPSYVIEEEEEREYTAEEIAELIQSGVDPDEVFNLKCKYKKTVNVKIEKIVIRDDQLTVNINDKKFILIARPDTPVSKFISTFRRISGDQARKEYLEAHTKSILEVTYYKMIDIKYESEVLENFIRTRVISLYNSPLKETDQELVYKWGRFNIYFSTQESLNKSKEIIKYFKSEYKNSGNVDAYLRKEFNMKIGKIEKEEK